jgi:hypothetical protein
MALIDLWQSPSSRQFFEDKKVNQIISFAGAGRLLDGEPTSTEFRSFLGVVPSNLLRKYAEECLREKFDDNGLALQDLVNQIGRRLGFGVTDGRYRGSSRDVGFDGLWTSPDQHSIIVEVKTTNCTT